MDDLISRERALEAIEEKEIIIKGMRYSKLILADYNKKLREGLIDILKEVPSADAKLINRGHWITIGKTPYGSIIRKCSCCGIEKIGKAKSKYCPDCGAELNVIPQLEGQTSFMED